MKKKILFAVAAIIASLSAASAQTTEETFQRHNRWMVGGEFVRNIMHANGFGVTGIYADYSLTPLYRESVGNDGQVLSIGIRSGF